MGKKRGSNTQLQRERKIECWEMKLLWKIFFVLFLLCFRAVHNFSQAPRAMHTNFLILLFLSSANLHRKGKAHYLVSPSPASILHKCRALERNIFFFHLNRLLVSFCNHRMMDDCAVEPNLLTKLISAVLRDTLTTMRRRMWKLSAMIYNRAGHRNVTTDETSSIPIAQ